MSCANLQLSDSLSTQTRCRELTSGPDKGLPCETLLIWDMNHLDAKPMQCVKPTAAMTMDSCWGSAASGSFTQILRRKSGGRRLPRLPTLRHTKILGWGRLRQANVKRYKGPRSEKLTQLQLQSSSPSSSIKSSSPSSKNQLYPNPN
ncbi:hypothetical protein PCANC_08495 [Puccinia coronata f. sp. avenae]|uniref:Uncharacterized protein n=1 Tax=Puccinia coronata f. sp. avenae TaxID=200324 RepID=A0A2N5T4C6_9BASI|nr:hypothetical protein PCANC_08495 [Puccinia coronata f. sp. avenae]